MKSHTAQLQIAWMALCDRALVAASSTPASFACSNPCQISKEGGSPHEHITTRLERFGSQQQRVSVRNQPRRVERLMCYM
jgi:hypothetical protein